jgi:hypothetical protein
MTGGLMNGQTAVMNWFMQKSKNAGDFLADSILGLVYMLGVFIVLWLLKILQGHLFSRSGGYSILFYCRWDWINLLFLFWYVGTSLLRTLDRIKQVVSEAT